MRLAVLYVPQFFEFSDSDLEKVTRMMPTIKVPLLKIKNISWHVIVLKKKKTKLDSVQYFTLRSFPIYNSFLFQCVGGKIGVM